MIDETEHTCQFCYYEYFDGRAYPCSRCIRNKPSEDMWKPKVKARQTKVKRGCTYCKDKDDCPDAYTEVSQYCGGYEQTDCAWK